MSEAGAKAKELPLSRKRVPNQEVLVKKLKGSKFSSFTPPPPASTPTSWKSHVDLLEFQPHREWTQNLVKIAVVVSELILVQTNSHVPSVAYQEHILPKVDSHKISSRYHLHPSYSCLGLSSSTIDGI